MCYLGAAKTAAETNATLNSNEHSRIRLFGKPIRPLTNKKSRRRCGMAQPGLGFKFRCKGLAPTAEFPLKWAEPSPENSISAINLKNAPRLLPRRFWDIAIMNNLQWKPNS
jgi:hypothetical protein